MGNNIEEQEILYRMVKNNPTMWKDELGRPSSALFKDSKGVSVDRDIDREQQQVIESMENRGESLIAIASVGVIDCYQVETIVREDSLDENIYHALILNAEDKVELTNSKARRLAKACKVVKKY